MNKYTLLFFLIFCFEQGFSAESCSHSFIFEVSVNLQGGSQNEFDHLLKKIERLSSKLKTEEDKRLFNVSNSIIAPAYTYYADFILKTASLLKSPRVVFLARDGISAFLIAKILIKRFPARYPNILDHQINYLYLNSDTVFSPLVFDYLKSSGFKKNEQIIFSDIGFYGSMINHLSATINKFGSKVYHNYFQFYAGQATEGSGLFYDLAKNVDFGGASVFSRISGNTVVHFLEDTYSGLLPRPRELVKHSDGHVTPFFPNTDYPEDILIRRAAALFGIESFVSHISLQDLNNLNLQNTATQLFKYLSDPLRPFEQLKVPHER